MLHKDRETRTPPSFLQDHNLLCHIFKKRQLIMLRILTMKKQARCCRITNGIGRPPQRPGWHIWRERTIKDFYCKCNTIPLGGSSNALLLVKSHLLHTAALFFRGRPFEWACFFVLFPQFSSLSLKWLCPWARMVTLIDTLAVFHAETDNSC